MPISYLNVAVLKGNSLLGMWLYHCKCLESVWVRNILRGGQNQAICCCCYLWKERNGKTSWLSSDNTFLKAPVRSALETLCAKLKSEVFATSRLSVTFFSLRWFFPLSLTTCNLLCYRKRNNQEIKVRSRTVLTLANGMCPLFFNRRLGSPGTFQSPSFRRLW